ncbi:MAG: hypothetical protein U9R15_15370 [Chloroflexota bacterium]|nr:hypothetical protein [Chloroflexota bacterium]
MKRYRAWIVVGVILLALVALTAWASSQTPMVARSSETWSRGRVIGQTPVKRRAALQTAPDGSAFLVWRNMGDQLELAHVGVDGEVLLTRVLSVGDGEAGDPQLRMADDGRLFLLWREGEYPNSTVRYVLLETDSALVGQPHTLSDPAIPVLDAPRLVTDARGRHHVIWADDAGIQWTVLDGAGALLAGPTPLTTSGRSPAVRVDYQGKLHLLWQQRPRVHVESLYYAVLDPEDTSGAMSEPEEIAQIVLRTGQGLGEPVIGLTSETVYVFWVIRDFKYAASSGEYAFFPTQSPQQKQIGPLQLRQGRYPEGLYSLGGAQTPLVAALSESVPDPEVMGAVRSQIAVLTLGQEVQEDIVTASAQASLKPTLVMDDHSNLHLVWLETAEFGVYRVVYASTAPEVMENYNALTLWDVLDAVFSNVFRFSTLIVALVAVLIMWGILPFLVLVIYHLVTSEETLHTARSWGALIVALALEVALTFILPPRLGVEAAWPTLRWVAPALSALAAALMLANVARRRKYMHLFAAYFLFTGINCLLQMVIYFLF